MEKTNKMKLINGAIGWELKIEPLTGEDWKQMKREADVIQCVDKQSFLREGDPVDRVYILVSGFVCLRSGDRVFDVLSPGNSFGAGLMRGSGPAQSSPVTAESLGVAAALVLSNEVYRKMIKSSESVSEYFQRQFQDRMSFQRLMRSIQDQPVSARIMALLREKSQLAQSGLFTKKLMSQIVGTTPETAIRVMSQFEDLGIIQMNEKEIHLTSEKVAEP